jgi:hypothetical protein
MISNNIEALGVSLLFDRKMQYAISKDAICYCGNYIMQPGCGVSLSRAQYAYNHYLM